MAQEFVLSTLEQLASVIRDEEGLTMGVEEEVWKLSDILTAIQPVLSDAEKKQFKDKLVKIWFEEFKDALYDVDDILDEWNYKTVKAQIVGGKASKSKVILYLHSLCSCFTRLATHHAIGSKIKTLRQKLDWIESEKYKYRLTETDQRHDKSLDVGRRKTRVLVDASQVYGRDLDKEVLLSRVLGGSSTTSNQQEISIPHNNSSVIAIVGTGGLGKTTLARLIFNDDQLKTHTGKTLFDKMMWVHISYPFDLICVTKAIIKETNYAIPFMPSDLNDLHQCLLHSIKDKRFFLVLDDVRNEDDSKWESLKLALKHGAQGSQVLVTTCKEEAAKMMGASYIHSLGQLTDDDCSTLLCSIALPDKNTKNYEVLREIGTKISNKCKGLPLAAKTVGGLLRFKREPHAWKSILESEIWELKEVEQGLLIPALVLSYHDLPSPLKSCFKYCSIFPKGHEINKDLLIKQWMAQGFLKFSTRENEEMEMIGEEYIHNLAMRSFFQDFKKDDLGENIIGFKMHDLVHDLAQFLTKSECRVMETSIGMQPPDNKVRHLTLLCAHDEGQQVNSTLTSVTCKARTLLVIIVGASSSSNCLSSDLFLGFSCLRVLCLREMQLTSLPGKLNKLIHLRYLDLSYNTDLWELPEALTSLYNLQTLILEGCSKLCKLPNGMGRMVSLRHLDTRGTDYLYQIPQGIGRLTCLQTLTHFIVGRSCTCGLCFKESKINELKDLNLLHGNLHISGLGRVEAVNEAFEAVLMEKKHLHSVTLDFKNKTHLEFEAVDVKRSSKVEETAEGILGGLEPHPNLVELVINNYLGLKFPSWCGGKSSVLLHLRTLWLRGCINCTELPALGQLPCLEVLHLYSLSNLKRIGLEFYYGNRSSSSQHLHGVAFPKLKKFSIRAKELEEWELGLEELMIDKNNNIIIMPSLLEAKVEDCMKLKTWRALSQVQSLNKLNVYNANGFIQYICGGGVCNACCDIDCVNSSLLVREEAAALELFPNVNYLSVGSMESMQEFKLAVVLPSLTYLAFCNCFRMNAITLPAFNLSKLETLELKGCPSMRKLPLPLPNLKKLIIEYPLLQLVPQGLAELTALESLTVRYCYSLRHMPEEVKYVTTLQKLEIYGCPTLQARCRKDHGEDWKLISHIPNIFLDGTKIQ